MAVGTDRSPIAPACGPSSHQGLSLHDVQACPYTRSISSRHTADGTTRPPGHPVPEPPDRTDGAACQGVHACPPGLHKDVHGYRASPFHRTELADQPGDGKGGRRRQSTNEHRLHRAAERVEAGKVGLDVAKHKERHERQEH